MAVEEDAPEPAEEDVAGRPWRPGGVPVAAALADAPPQRLVVAEAARRKSWFTTRVRIILVLGTIIFGLCVFEAKFNNTGWANSKRDFSVRLPKPPRKPKQ